MKTPLTILTFLSILFTACSSSERVSGADCIAEVVELTVPENTNFMTNVEILNQVSQSDGTIDHSLPKPVGGMFELMRNVRFPLSARDLTKPKQVLIQALIDEDGDVLDMVLLEPSRCDLTESAMKPLNSPNFIPARSIQSLLSQR